MDVGFSDSQLELRASVRDVLARECPPSMVRECLADPDRWRPLWKVVTDLGWTALAALDDEGGAGIVEQVAVLEEMGRAVAPVPFSSTVSFAAGALAAAGEAAAQWQEELAEGAVGAFGVTAPGGRALTPAAVVEGSRVTGAVGGVVDAARADVLVVLARRDGAPVLAVVRTGAGVDVSGAESVDPSRPVADVTVDATAEAVLPVDVHAALAVPLTAAAAELVGLGAGALDISVAHAKTREQFDKPIGAFQGVKHRLADCYVAVERARGLTYAAAMQVADADAAPAARWRSAALAKAAASEAAVECARAGVQVHGALGQTWEHDMHLYLRRAWSGAVVLGDSRRLYRDVAAATVAAGTGV